jgi:thiol-disulfide isomerase/thioredoxin
VWVVFADILLNIQDSLYLTDSHFIIKRLNIKFLKIIFFVLIILPGCDIIREPFLEDAPALNDKLRKVLLEEFTGHLCPNCPAAAATAEKLRSFYGNKLIIISYHAGFYARTTQAFPADYRSATGDELNSIFNVQYYPSGMINRNIYAGSRLQGHTDWSKSIASGLGSEPQVFIHFSAPVREPGGNFTVGIKLKLITPAPAPLRLCLYLTEDSLVSPQSISNDPRYPSGYIPEYLHMHLFRKAVNGTWGDLVFETGTATPEEKTFSYDFIPGSGLVPANCRLVAFIINEESRTVLQAESVGLLP